MTDYYFEESDNTLTLKYVRNGSERSYHIPKNDLGRVRGEESEWIMQLMDKTWVEKDMLYDLANQIKQYKPDNKINWESTLAIVDSYYN